MGNQTEALMVPTIDPEAVERVKEAHPRKVQKAADAEAAGVSFGSEGRRQWMR